jgi:hypothetical protein
MAINSYGTLMAAINAWGDLGSTMTSEMDNIILLANDTLNYGLDLGMTTIPALRTREMEAIASLTPSSSVCTLPSDYLQYRRVVQKASPRRPLTYITPDEADQKYPDRSSGPANEFTIVGGSLYMYPLGSTDIELTYYQKIADLTEANTTNWLITKHPTIYLHACMLHVGLYRKEQELVQQSAGIVAAFTRSKSASNEMANYAYAPSRVRGITVA